MFISNTGTKKILINGKSICQARHVPLDCIVKKKSFGRVIELTLPYIGSFSNITITFGGILSC